MLLLYGVKNKAVGEASFDKECSKCTQRTHTLYFFQKYFHFFFIPLFPLWKTGTIECSHCKFTENMSYLPFEVLKRAKEQMKLHASFPWFIFFVPLTFFILIIYGIIVNSSSQDRVQAMIADPQVCDLGFYYEGLIDKKIFKINKVENNFIVIQLATDRLPTEEVTSYDYSRPDVDMTTFVGGVILRISLSNYKNTYNVKKVWRKLPDSQC